METFIFIKDGARRGMCRKAGDILAWIAGKIGSLNPGQKKVFWELFFFMFVNALILVAGIVVLTKLINKL